MSAPRFDAGAEAYAVSMGDFVRHWAAELAEGTTPLPGGGARFTPGLLPRLQAEISGLSDNDLRWALVASLVHHAALLVTMEEVARGD